MKSVLIVSSDVDSTSKLESAAHSEKCRVRCVSAFESAREWIAMQRFDLLLVDAALDRREQIKLLDSFWQTHPLAEAGIFNLNGPVNDPWEAMLIGARVFSSEEALEEIVEFLREEKTVQASEPELDRLGVLVVDDLDSPRDILCAYIAALGYDTVKGVPNGEEALKELKLHPEGYFCVILDISMPAMNGIHLLHQIRQDPEIAKLPVVMCTAHPTAVNLVECIREGASGFVAKPPRKKLLLSELEKAKRFFRSRTTPRICAPDDAELLEQAMLRRGLL